MSFRRQLVAARDSLAKGLRRLPATSRFIGPPRRSVWDTPAWCATGDGGSDTCVHLLTPERVVSRAAPAFLDPPMAARFVGMETGRLKPRFVAELPAGRWWGRAYGYVIDQADALHHDLSPAFKEQAPARGAEEIVHDALRQPWLPPIRRLTGNVAAIGTLFCDNFHHWLLDTLPKFRLLQESGWPMERLDAVLLPDGTDRPWHRQALARLGVAPEKVLRGRSRFQVEAERLLVPVYTEPGPEPERYDYSPEGLEFVRDLFLADPPQRSAWPKQIVVSRELATSRRWVAGQAGHDRLAREGFATVCLENYSLEEQAAFFHHADRIVMPTGGGLANLVFCRAGTRVVELFSASYLPTFSIVLSSALDLEYFALVGPRSDTPPFDIDVSIERVLDAVA